MVVRRRQLGGGFNLARRLSGALASLPHFMSPFSNLVLVRAEAELEQDMWSVAGLEGSLSKRGGMDGVLQGLTGLL